MNNPQNPNPNQPKAIRKLSLWLTPKLTQKYQLTFQKLRTNSIFNSPQFQQLKTVEFFKKLNKLFVSKFRQYFTTINQNLLIREINKSQTNIDTIKSKDRIYQTKVKSLRVLSRQWKQKKSQNMYKSKYFTPKAQQTPKMQKQKVVQQVYIILRTLLRNKYLQVFNTIKRTQVIKSIRSKTLYLFSYLANHRRYRLIYGFQKLKLTLIKSRQQKHSQQISQLDNKLAPVQDAQLQSLKQKQQKLQSALDNVYKQKQTVSKQVDDQINNIQQSLQQKRQQIKLITQQKIKLQQQLKKYRQIEQKFVFGREEIFYLIYQRLLVNVRLWREMGGSGLEVKKEDVVGWLTGVRGMGLGVDRVGMETQAGVNQFILSLTELIKEYQARQKSSTSTAFNKSKQQISKPDYSSVYQSFFCCSSHLSTSQSLPYEQILLQTKFAHKMIGQIMRQNEKLVKIMLVEMDDKYRQVQSQSREILEG